MPRSEIGTLGIVKTSKLQGCLQCFKWQLSQPKLDSDRVNRNKGEGKTKPELSIPHNPEVDYQKKWLLSYLLLQPMTSTNRASSFPLNKPATDENPQLAPRLSWPICSLLLLQTSMLSWFPDFLMLQCCNLSSLNRLKFPPLYAVLSTQGHRKTWKF